MKKYVKTPTTYQMEATECGAASLSMILAYYNSHIPLERLRVMTGVSRDGCNAKNIMRAGKNLNMEVHAYRKSLEDLLKIAPPAIIHWNFNHFVVFEGVKNGHPYINDPSIGRRKLTMDELDECYTGIVLTFKPLEGFEKTAKEKSLLNFIKDRLKGQETALLSLIIIGLCLVVPGIMIPAFSEVFVDDILLGGNTSWMSYLIVIMIGTVLFKFLLTWYRGTLLLKLQNKMSLISSNKFLAHLFRLPISFFDQRYAGDLTGRIQNNNNLSNFLAGDLAETVLNIIVAAFYGVILFMYSPTLSLIGMGGLLINILLIKLTANKLSNDTMKKQQDEGKLVGVLYAGINITSTLKASGAENEYTARLLGNYAKCINMNQKTEKFQQIANTVPQAISQITDALVIMIGGIFVIRGNITAGMLIAFTALLDSFTDPVNKLVGFGQKIQILKADMKRVEDIQKYKADEKFNAEEKADISTKLDGNVTLDDVSFGYSTLEKPLIENFNFELNCGESIAFVGASGSGKSTVSKIISGLYQPWTGNVLFGGVPINKIPKNISTASVSTVSQDITLFSGTVRDNLTMWNDKVMEVDIINAAKDACIHDVITKMPGAYDAMLAEGGGNLSGGQRQRMEIARALVSNPTILVMDEATSALDPIIEKKIVDNIKRRGCTCVIVAHRLSAIRDCDQIIVMEQGEIVQRGTHEALAAEQGHYQRLIENI